MEEMTAWHRKDARAKVLRRKRAVDFVILALVSCFSKRIAAAQNISLPKEQ